MGSYANFLSMVGAFRDAECHLSLTSNLTLEEFVQNQEKWQKNCRREVRMGRLERHIKRVTTPVSAPTVRVVLCERLSLEALCSLLYCLNCLLRIVSFCFFLLPSLFVLLPLLLLFGFVLSRPFLCVACILPD